MRRMSYSGAFTTMNPSRTGPVGLVVDFLVEIHPLSFVAPMAGDRSEVLFGVVVPFLKINVLDFGGIYGGEN